ncbi:MAG: hypothetical protein ACOX6X_02070 [Dethiobacteria bacterium]|jgi:hypothetical protein
MLLPQPGIVAAEGEATATVKIFKVTYDENGQQLEEEIDYLTESMVNKGYVEEGEEDEEIAFKIKIALSNAEWAADLVDENKTKFDATDTNKEKIKLLLDNIKAEKNPEQWDKVIKRVWGNLGSETITIEKEEGGGGGEEDPLKTLTITVPKIEDNTITENETIKIMEIPSALLENWSVKVDVSKRMGKSYNCYKQPAGWTY